jgi:hypothetical protein
LSANIGYNQDSNKYLYSSNWIESGLRLSWNLMKLPQWPALKRAIGNQATVDDLRRYAQGMAVLTQVRIGVQNYGLSRVEYQMSEQSANVDSRLLNYTRSAVKASTEGELEVIRAESRALLTEYQKSAAYAQAQAAWGRMYNSIGLDVLPAALENTTVEGLSKAIKQTTNEWQRVTFKSAAPRADALPEVKLVSMGGSNDVISEAAGKALKRHGINAQSEMVNPWTLEVSWAPGTTESVGTSSARVNVKLMNPLGQSVHERSHVVPVGERTDSVLKAAIESVLDSDATALHAAFKPVQVSLKAE